MREARCVAKKKKSSRYRRTESKSERGERERERERRVDIWVSALLITVCLIER